MPHKAKQPSRQKQKSSKDWPAIVYMWSIVLGLVSYAIIEILFRTSLPHPFHWLAGLAGGAIGVPIGWLWYRWRGDVF